MTKFDPRRIDTFIRRAVEALESIAKSLKNDSAPTRFEQHVYASSDLTPVDIYRQTKQALGDIKGETLPAFFMAGKDDVFDVDNEAAEGFARLEPEGIYIKMSPEYYPDLIRKIIAEGEPEGISIRLHHRKPLT